MEQENRCWKFVFWQLLSFPNCALPSIKGCIEYTGYQGIFFWKPACANLKIQNFVYFNCLLLVQGIMLFIQLPISKHIIIKDFFLLWKVIDFTSIYFSKKSLLYFQFRPSFVNSISIKYENCLIFKLTQKKTQNLKMTQLCSPVP